VTAGRAPDHAQPFQPTGGVVEARLIRERPMRLREPEIIPVRGRGVPS
jgi:hypothetical protein